MCSSKQENPQEFLLHSKREEYSSIFQFIDYMAFVSYVQNKVHLAFHRYYGNDKPVSEQNYRLEAGLLYTEQKVLQMQETKSEGSNHAYREQIYGP